MKSIIKYNPWSMLRDIQEDVNQLFNENLSEKGISKWSPHADITESKDKYSIIADLPGVDPREIKISIDNNNILTIEGQRKSEARDEKSGYSRIERFSGSFYRQFSLPDNVQSEDIRAKSKNGVIEISIPKKESTSPKQVQIKVDE